MADLAGVEQLIDRSQTCAIGDMVWYGLRQGYFDGESTLTGDDAAGDPHPGDYSLPRRFELAARLNRLRGFIVRP
ncbi:MAG: hypothetical protein ACYDGS_07535 [Thermoleophilia bacterium]